ncbi:MAG: hypothetical protein ABR976_13840 [Terracidiphilus sp.]
MATKSNKNSNGKETGSRYWVSFDFGLGANYREFYEWLDAKDASECGIGVATLTSPLTRDQIAAEIKQALRHQVRPRVYLISMKHGGRFIMGSRKASPWTGFAVRHASAVDES